MPSPTQQIPPLTRRQLLARSTGVACAFAGAGALAACGTDTVRPGAPAASLAVGSGSVSQAVATSERALIARYTETIAEFVQLAPSLEPLLRQHEEHLAATGVEVPEPPVHTPPSDLHAATSALRQAELSAAIERRESCLLATEPELIRTLTFIAASEASHVAALRAVSHRS